MAVSLGMSLITFIAGLCLVIGSASAVEVAERELTKYQIRAVEIPIPAEIKELHAWMHDYHLFQEQANRVRSEWRLI